jgi:hypothetical protein
MAGVIATGVAGAASAQPVPTEQPLAEPAGERVDFEISFEEGDVFAYRTRMDLRIEQEFAEGELAEQVLAYDVTTRFTVQGVEEDGTATLSMKVTEADVNITDGEETLSVEVGELAEGEEYATPYAASLANNVVTLVVAPDGRITSVLGAEAYQEALEATEGADPRQLGFFNAAQIKETFEPLFTIEQLNGVPRRVGTGWATSREVELPPVAVIDLSYNWKLQGVLENVATLTASVETTVRRPNTPDPARPTIALEDSSGNVVTQWDSSTERVTRRISTLSMDTRWALGELEIGQKQRSTVRIELVPVGE